MANSLPSGWWHMLANSIFFFFHQNPIDIFKQKQTPPSIIMKFLLFLLKSIELFLYLYPKLEKKEKEKRPKWTLVWFLKKLHSQLNLFISLDQDRTALLFLFFPSTLLILRSWIWDGCLPAFPVQLYQVSSYLKLSTSHSKIHLQFNVDLTLFQAWLLFLYTGLALRENILRVNGSDIRPW